MGCLGGLVLAGESASPAARNVVIFVADGLRADSVNASDAPTMWALRHEGVSFPNSHSLFPTFTTPNASAIATGHYLGDTGDFSNSMYLGFLVFNAGNFGKATASPTPFIESDQVLGDLDDHLEGNFIGEDSLLALARAQGFGTAAIGKLGPTAIQDVSQLQPNRDGRFDVPRTILIDDLTGGDAPPLDPEVIAGLKSAGLPLATPPRIQPAGDAQHAGARNANYVQQTYFIEATTRVVLPLLRQRGRPFVLVYWSRDPDGTQHNQGDSLNLLTPGINGVTSRAAVHEADDNLRQLLDAIHADAVLAANTDVFVTADHGFATISKHDLDAQGAATASPSAQLHYKDVPTGFLPPGFLAIDLAAALHEPLFDPDSLTRDAHGNPGYQRVVAGAVETPQQRPHAALGSGLIGGSGSARDVTDADVVVTANGGSDLIYLPSADAALARRVVEALEGFDYIGAIFLDEQYGSLPGTLPLSSIALQGSAKLPRPALLVAFKTFELDPKKTGIAAPLLNAVQIADSPLQQGQGMHGSFGRDNTFNFMAAEGPDFKAGYVDPWPVSNADIAPTLRALLQLTASAHGTLTGRVLGEVLRAGGEQAGTFEHCIAAAAPAADGRRTVLEYQRYQGRLYFDRAQYVAAPQQKSGCHR